MSEPRTIEFWAGFVPPKTTHQRKKIVRRGSHASLADDVSLVMARNLYALMFRRHAPATPIEGPVFLEIVIVWPFRAKERKGDREGGGRRRHDVRPDASNLGKTIEDVLVELGFMHDDGQVSDLSIKKRWGRDPGVRIRIEQVHEWEE